MKDDCRIENYLSTKRMSLLKEAVALIIEVKYENTNGKNDKEEMDVEGALALDLTELEAMLAIDSEQVRYDQQVKKHDSELSEASTSCVSATSFSSQSLDVNSGQLQDLFSQNHGKKRRKRKLGETRKAVKLEDSPFSSTDINKLGNIDSATDISSASTSKYASDTAESQDPEDLLPMVLSSPDIDQSSSSFAKPSPPCCDGKRRNPRVYSYDPVSRTRLTVPKRQFSPNPKKGTKLLTATKKVVETINLTDLTKILCTLDAVEFSLPPDFTAKFRKRPMSETRSESVLVTSKEDKSIDDENLPHASSQALVSGNDSKAVGSIIGIAPINTEQVLINQEEDMKVCTSNRQLKRQCKRRDIADSASEDFSSVNFSVETQIEDVVKEESPTPISISIPKSIRGKPRKRTGLIKLKRGRLHKSFQFRDAIDKENASTNDASKSVMSALLPDASSEDSCNEPGLSVSQTVDQESSDSHDCSSQKVGDNIRVDNEGENSGTEILVSDMSEVLSDSVANRTQNNASEETIDTVDATKDDCDDGGRLHIVEPGDDDDSCNVGDRFLPITEVDHDSDSVMDVVSMLLARVCEACSSHVDLIMEPLKRPSSLSAEESRRVPPLRIRIPRKRARRPARSHNYSPPLPVTRHRFEEVLRRSDATSKEINDAVVEIGQKSQREVFTSHAESGSVPLLLEDSNINSSAPSDSNSVLASLSSSSTEKCTVTDSVVMYEESAIIEKGDATSNLSQSCLSESRELQSQNTLVSTSPIAGLAVEVTGRSTRKRPVSYEQLYPSLFRRRRKSSHVKSFHDLDQPQSSTHPSSGSMGNVDVAPECMSAEKRRKRRQRGRPVNNKAQQPRIKNLATDEGVKDFENRENLDTGDTLSEEASSKAKDVHLAESTGILPEKVSCVREKSRRLSNSSSREKSDHVTSEDVTVSSVNTRLQVSCPIASETDIFSSDQSHSPSMFRSVRRKSSIIDPEPTRPEATEVSVSDRSKSKRLYSRSVPESVKQKISSRNMPYFKRISQRRKLNPLANGLKSRSSDDNTSFFYREILLRGDDLKKSDGGDITVDVDSELTIEDDEESSFGGPAISAATEISRMLSRPETDEDYTESDHDYFLTLDNIRTMFIDETPDRKRLLNDIMAIILAQYCSDIASQNIHGGESIRYNTIVKNAYRLRSKAMIFSQVQRNDVKWVHQIFLRRLAVPMLAVYIDLLRFSKIPGRNLLDLLLDKNSDDKILNKVNSHIQDFLTIKPLDPEGAAISKTLNKRHVKDLCLLLVSPNFIHTEYHSRSRSHEYMFRILLPNIADRVESIRMNLPPVQNMSICEAVEYSIRLVSRKVVEVHRKYPDLKIVLVGWGTSCVINHQVVQSMPNVSAIINFAFPMKTADGPRGHVDDDILLTYCPTLFVVGDQATDCDVRQLQIMATRMIAPTGVIVIGSANCSLYPSTFKLTIERFTHRTVQRALLDDVIDFLQLYCTSNSTQGFRLHPLKLVEVNDVDLSILRTSNLFSSSQTKRGKSEAASKGSSSIQSGKRCLSDNSPNVPVKKQRFNEDRSIQTLKVPDRIQITHQSIPSNLPGSITPFTGSNDNFSSQESINGTRKY
ncbi:unnamed protein product [Thelazia callipaeda]|uniref:Shugoshin_C domain-containing protein n=1 Tax=Thelazia callipaeda TaxID=103827 RepID=A0A158RC08_THECL|nr:unnamed protein product [Thelazia callipaeda]